MNLNEKDSDLFHASHPNEIKHILNDPSDFNFTCNGDQIVKTVTGGANGLIAFPCDTNGHLKTIDGENSDEPGSTPLKFTDTYFSQDNPVNIIGHATNTSEGKAIPSIDLRQKYNLIYNQNGMAATMVPTGTIKTLIH